MERIFAECLSALDHCPSVQAWGPEMRSEHVASRFSPGAVVAELDGLLAGVASATLGRRHRRHAFLSVEVRPSLRRRGVGSTLLAEMSGRVGRPFTTRQFLSDAGTIEFLRNRGFRHGEIATEARIDPQVPATSGWIDAALAASPGAVVPATPDVAMGRLFDDLYVAIHPYSVPDPLPDDRALGLYLGDALEGTIFGAYAGEVLVGAATLNTSPFERDAAAAHLAWVGATDAGLVPTLVAHCLAAARERGLLVSVEASDNHPDLNRCVREIAGVDAYEDLTIMVSG